MDGLYFSTPDKDIICIRRLSTQPLDKPFSHRLQNADAKATICLLQMGHHRSRLHQHHVAARCQVSKPEADAVADLALGPMSDPSKAFFPIERSLNYIEAPHYDILNRSFM